MDNELYYNKYLFNQKGGNSVPVSTHDQISSKKQVSRSDNIVDASKDLALTAANAVGVIASKFAQKGLKEGTEFVEKGLDKALGLDPNKSLEDQAKDVALKVKEKGQLAIEVAKNPDFKEGITDVAQASGIILDAAVEEIQPVINVAIEKTGDTLKNNSEKLAQTAVNVGTGTIMAAADAVPGLGTALQVAKTTGDVIKDGAEVIGDTSNTFTEITSQANSAAQKTIDSTKEAQSKISNASSRIVKAINEVTEMIEKGQGAIEKGASLNDVKKLTTASLGKKMNSIKSQASKNLVDIGAEATGMKNTVKAARALGMSDENILKKSAKIASKSASIGGGKTRKKRKRKSKTRNKRRHRNKSRKGKRSRKSFS